MNQDLREAGPLAPGRDDSVSGPKDDASLAAPPGLSVAAAASLIKPKLRGVLHMINTPLALIGGLLLLILADDPLVRVGCAVWTLTAVLLFGHSAVYHRGRWTEKVEAVLRRVDHSNIAVFIAGTYTPLALALLEGTSRVVLLSVIWGCALAEVLFRTFWLGAPRWLYVALYIAMGWAAVAWLPQLWASGGPLVIALIGAGGLVYTAGAVVYALKRPNPSPTWFGFHEIFHSCTVIAAGCHYAAIALITFR